MNYQTSSVPAGRSHHASRQRSGLTVKAAWDLILATLAISFFAFALLAEGAVATEATAPKDRLEHKLLRASTGVQYPGSESDSTWTFVSYPGEDTMPAPERFQQISGCPVADGGGTTRLDFDATFDRLTRIEPWMDEGQVKSARGFRKIERIMLRSYDAGSLAVYRCDTAEFGQVHFYFYFVGLNDDGISGLLTASTET